MDQSTAYILTQAIDAIYTLVKHCKNPFLQNIDR